MKLQDYSNVVKDSKAKVHDLNWDRLKELVADSHFDRYLKKINTNLTDGDMKAFIESMVLVSRCAGTCSEHTAG
jgi:hypothetical protein